MKILNEQIKIDLINKVPLKLNLGSGPTKYKDFYSVDLVSFTNTDIIANLDHSLELIPDNSVSDIYSRHSFEHITNFLGLMKEIFRISQPNANIQITVPHFSNKFSFSDPTHTRFFGLFTMYYFCSPESQPSIRRVPAFYTDVKFKIESIKIEFYANTFAEKVFNKLFSNFINRSFENQIIYEKWFSVFFQAWQITYKLKADK